MKTIATNRSRAAAVIRTVGRHKIALTNLTKPLYPSGFTKGDVIDYYTSISGAMLPHLKNRAITLKRYPNGSTAPFFFEKSCPKHRPPWVRTATIASRRQNGSLDYCVVNDLAGLTWVAQLAALELHVPLARAAAPERPTCMVFDLDPGPPATILDCARLSLQMRDTLARLNLKCFAKTSGSKGLHLYIPLNTPCTFDQTKHFANALASLMAKNDPDRVLSNMTRSLRPGKVFIDWSQNDTHKTTACVYTLRAGEHPTVSTPVTWTELESALGGRRPADLSFEAPQVIRRVVAKGDLFAPVLKLRQKLPGEFS